MSNAIDRLYEEAMAVLEKLDTEISLKISASDYFRKSLLIAAASYFEHILKNHIVEYVKSCAPEAVYLHSFVEQKAVDRQYHTWFNWKSPNANAFFGLFGEDFKNYMLKEIKNNPVLDEAMKAFMEIGRERNNLAHNDYATFTMEKSLAEIYEAYNRALIFVKRIPDALKFQEANT